MVFVVNTHLKKNFFSSIENNCHLCCYIRNFKIYINHLGYKKPKKKTKIKIIKTESIKKVIKKQKQIQKCSKYSKLTMKLI